MTENRESSGPISTEYVARVIGAFGHLMSDFRDRDLAMQNAIADLTRHNGAKGIDMFDLQHIDLVTQTHADLAKLLPKLAQCLRDGDICHGSLLGTLTLRSLEDVLLGSPEEQDHHFNGQDTEPGEMYLF